MLPRYAMRTSGFTLTDLDSDGPVTGSVTARGRSMTVLVDRHSPT